MIYRLMKTAATVLCVCVMVAAQNKPYPQAVNFAGCIKPSAGQVQTNTAIKTLYDNYFKPNIKTTGDGIYVDITTADPENIASSEMQGMGMIISALMAGYDAGAKANFDGMLKFYLAHPTAITPLKLMSAKVTNAGAPSPDAATGGDMDAAYGTLLAAAQWGNASIPTGLSKSYLDYARDMITAIKGMEMGTANKRALLGDWSKDGGDEYSTRSADWRPATMRAFADATGDSYWDAAADTCYSLMSRINSPATGLMPDYATGSIVAPDPAAGGTGELNGEKYGFYACRYPLNIATDYALYGTAAAKTALGKTTDWLVAKYATAAGILAGPYALNGTTATAFTSSSFTAPFVSAGITDSKYMSFLNDGWTTIAGTMGDEDDLYASTLRLMSMLVISGNWWNPVPAAVPDSFAITLNPGTGGTIAKSPDRAKYASGEVVTLTASPGSGYSFSSWSGDTTGTSTSITVAMNTNKSIGATFVSVAGLVNIVRSSLCDWYAAGWDGGTVDTGIAIHKDTIVSVGYATPMQPNGSTWPGAMVSVRLPGTLSGLTAITITYSSSHDISLEVPFDENYNPYYVLLTKSATFKTVVIPLAQFAEKTDYGMGHGALNIDTLKELVFCLVTPVETAASSGTVAIREMYLAGVDISAAAVAPSGLSTLPADTTLLRGWALSKTASASGGNPAPTFLWKHGAVSLTAGPALNIPAVTKADSGAYSFDAMNSVDTVTSGTMNVHVYDTAKVDPAFAYALGTKTNFYSSLAAAQAAVLSAATVGDGAIITWLKGSVVVGNGTTCPSTPLDTSAVYRYFVRTVIAGNPVTPADSSAGFKVAVSEYLDPYNILVSKHLNSVDSVDVVVTVDAIKNAMNIGLPYPNGLTLSWNTPDNIGTGSLVLTRDQATPGYTATIALAIPDSSWTFSKVIAWKKSDWSTDTVSAQQPVTTVDLRYFPSAAGLSLTSSYSSAKPDSVVLTFSGTAALTAVRDSILTIVPVVGGAARTALTLSAAALIANPMVTVHIGTVARTTLSVDIGLVSVFGRSSAIKSLAADSVGVSRPVYRGILSAELSAGGDRAFLLWDAPDTAVDSIRIWKSTIVLPLSSEPPGLPEAVLAGTALRDTVSDLLPSQIYRFGLQVLRNGLWSFVGASQDSVTTPTPDTSLTILMNVMHVDSSWFDKTTNALIVKWSADTTRSPWPENVQLEWGWSAGLDSVSVCSMSSSPAAWSSFMGTYSGTLTGSLADSVRFDTTWHVGLWLRARNVATGIGPAKAPAGESKAQIAVGHFSWQVLHANSSSTSLIMSGNNDRVLIARESLTSIVSTTVKAYLRSGALPKGFVDVGAPSVKLLAAAGSLRSKVGIAWGTLPAGITAANIAMYRDSAGKLWVVHADSLGDGYVWTSFSSKQADSIPFLVLADTVHPSIESLDTSDVIAEGALADTTQVHLADNIVNLHWQVVYGSGNTAYSQVYSGADLNDSTATVAVIMRNIGTPAAFSPACGCRALLIVSDGVYYDTLNISKQVTTTGLGTSLPDLKWTPLSLHYEPDNTGLAAGLAGLGAFDKTKWKAARWESGNWNILNEGEVTSGTLPAGAVVWLISRGAKAIDFPAGKTTALSAPQLLTVPSKDWRDFATAVAFPVSLKQMLAEDSFARDSCIVYRWDRTVATGDYTAVPVYRSLVDDALTFPDSLFDPAAIYTVYNNTDHAHTLQIPVDPPGFSFAASPLPFAKREAETKRWQVSVSAHRAGGSAIGEVCVAGNEALAKGALFRGPLPPSFDSMSVAILDDAQRSSYVAGSFGMVSNRSFELEIRNRGSLAQTVVLYATHTDEDVLGAFVSKGSSPSIRDSMVITVDPHSTLKQTVAVGTQSSFNEILQKLSLSPAIRMNAGTGAVHFNLNNRGECSLDLSLYNLRGVRLYHERADADIHFSLDDCGLSSGYYIAVARIVGPSGQIISTQSFSLPLAR